MPSSHLILCRPLLLLPPIPPSIRVFSNEPTLCMRWPKYWSLGFSISPSNEHPGLISFRMNWLDLLCIQGTLKSLLQHQSSKASILWRSAFFTVQLSHSHKFLWDKYYLYFSLIDAETKAQKGKVIFPDLHNSALRGVLLIQLCIGEWMHLEIGRAGDEYFYPHYHLVIKWPPECIQTWTKCNLFKDDFVHLPDKLGNVKLVVSF